MRKVFVSSLIVSLALLSGCGSSPAPSPSLPSETASMPILSPSPKASSNEINTAAASLFRAALMASLASQTSSGLTESWKDAEGNPLQVLSYDPAATTAVQFDYGSDDAQVLDVDAMMPMIALNELDALEANAETDSGSVTSNASDTYLVMNQIDDATYATEYFVGKSGLIEALTLSIDGDVAMTANFVYKVSDEGKAAYAKLK